MAALRILDRAALSLALARSAKKRDLLSVEPTTRWMVRHADHPGPKRRRHFHSPSAAQKPVSTRRRLDGSGAAGPFRIRPLLKESAAELRTSMKVFPALGAL